MTEIIINLPVLVTAIFLIVFVLLHKKIEKKLDFTILILVASVVFMVNLKMVWLTVFLLAVAYFGIKYTYKAKNG